MKLVTDWDWSAVATVVPLPPKWPDIDSVRSHKLTVAVVGYGYWGQKLAAALIKQGVIVVPVDPAQPKTKSWPVVLADPTIQGIVIATPEKTHASLVLAALTAGKAVLVEKPAATAVTDWQKIQQLAWQKQLPVLVDYTFLLSRAAQLWQHWQTQFTVELGELKLLRSWRLTSLTPARIQSKAAPVWLDAAIHDLYLLRWSWAAQPNQWQVSVPTTATISSQVQPVLATLTAELDLPNSKTAQFQADYSWIAQTPQRVWEATYSHGGKLRWEKRGSEDWLRASSAQGKTLAEMSLSDLSPSPLDRTVQLFLAWTTGEKIWSPTTQQRWQNYWTTVQADITQLIAIQ